MLHHGIITIHFALFFDTVAADIETFVVACNQFEEFRALLYYFPLLSLKNKFKNFMYVYTFLIILIDNKIFLNMCFSFYN